MRLQKLKKRKRLTNSLTLKAKKKKPPCKKKGHKKKTVNYIALEHSHKTKVARIVYINIILVPLY